MSTELYFQVELQNPRNRRWWHFARLRLSDDYTLYALLAGVRGEDGPVPQEQWGEPRGLPQDCAESTLAEDALTIDDQAAALDFPDACRQEDADRWVREGAARFLRHSSAVTHPDFHSGSWLSRAELRSVRDAYAAYDAPDLAHIDAVIAMLDTLANQGIESRVVFWFGI
jgi:hypothetical protein